MHVTITTAMASTMSELARDLGYGCVSGWAEAYGLIAAVLVSFLGPPSAVDGFIGWNRPTLDEELCRPIKPPEANSPI